MRPAIFKLWPLAALVASIALYFGLSLAPSWTLAPSILLNAETKVPDQQARPQPEAPAPAVVAVRETLSRLAERKDFGAAYTEDLKATTAFYAAEGQSLQWVRDDGFSDRGHAVIGEIKNADDWGLHARSFTVPQLPAGRVTPDVAAAAELELTFAVLKYARYARGGRIRDPSQLSKLLDYTLPIRHPKSVLADMAATDDPAGYLRSLHPQHEQFQALRRMLLKLRRPSAPGDDEIVFGKRLQTVLPQLVRADAETAAMPPDTVRTPEDQGMGLRMARILVNMERWRWMPDELGAFHVWNNVPEFSTRVIKAGKVVHSDKIIVGQPDWPTPAFAADMKTIVFHPSWGVPDGIKRKELAPLLRKSSGGNLIGLFTGAPTSRSVLDQHNLQAYYQGRPIDPNQVDWGNANMAAYEFRQPPGPTNVLGKIKFMFPNTHDVYMHDTPQRDLFARSFRGLSHGCLRVGDPRRFAEVLLAQDKGWQEQQVGRLWSGGTREVRLDTAIPVYMVYFTATVDRDGTLRTFGDLYGIDARMGTALFGKDAPFVTPRYDGELAQLRARDQPAQASAAPGLSSLADAISDIFSP